MLSQETFGAVKDVSDVTYKQHDSTDVTDVTYKQHDSTERQGHAM